MGITYLSPNKTNFLAIAWCGVWQSSLKAVTITHSAVWDSVAIPVKWCLSGAHFLQQKGENNKTTLTLPHQIIAENDNCVYCIGTKITINQQFTSSQLQDAQDSQESSTFYPQSKIMQAEKG
jgi:hypothetical protein